MVHPRQWKYLFAGQGGHRPAARSQEEGVASEYCADGVLGNNEVLEFTSAGEGRAYYQELRDNQDEAGSQVLGATAVRGLRLVIQAGGTGSEESSDGEADAGLDGADAEATEQSEFM